jgi:hypothetical protein
MRRGTENIDLSVTKEQMAALQMSPEYESIT